MTANLSDADRTLLHRLRALPGGAVLGEHVRDVMQQRDEAVARAGGPR